MSSHVPSLRRRLEQGDRLVGGLVRMPAEEIVEMLALTGFDFVLVDCEHGAPDVASLRHHVTAAESFALPVLVRSGAGDHAFVLRALDLGAQGVVAPHIDSVADAEALVRSVRYGPHGERGFAAYSRVGGYGSVDPAQHHASAADVLVIAMIESPAAVVEAGRIVAVPGVDGYLVGTSDLRAARSEDDPALADLVAAAHRTAEGSLRVDMAGSAPAARESLDDGARMIVHNLTLEMMQLFAQLRVDA